MPLSRTGRKRASPRSRENRSRSLSRPTILNHPADSLTNASSDPGIVLGLEGLPGRRLWLVSEEDRQ